jgi:hypothetical protein
MRTMLTPDDDVSSKLNTESRRVGRHFREIVNQAQWWGLESRVTARRRPFDRFIGDPLRCERAGLCLSERAWGSRE